jgi:3-dehydroquinate dehydratase II
MPSRNRSEWVTRQANAVFAYSIPGRMGCMPVILLLHGPNLNLLGQREPEIYGTATLDDYVAACTAAASGAGVELEAFQTNHEGAIVDTIHAARGRVDAIVINPGAFTHYAWSLHDALAAFDGFKIEVHISNPNAREPWRHTSVVAPVVHGSIIGFGIDGYRMAVAEAARRLTA